MVNTPLHTEKFSLWLEQTLRSQKTGEAVNVPCGQCNACCTSSYFIHIKPDEKNTLGRIPRELLFAAPGMPRGHAVLGYNEKGYCPMYVNNRCSIYNCRPRTCRTYDCRVFAATGLSVGDDKKRIAMQSARWRFTFSDEADNMKFKAVREAAKFINENSSMFPDGFVPSNTTQQVMVAMKVYGAFLDNGHVDCAYDRDNVHDMVAHMVDAYKKFEEVYEV